MLETKTNNVVLRVDGRIATVTLDRPGKLNALSPEMIEALADFAMDIDKDASIRCAILSAAGDRAFCVGADINAWSALQPLDMWRHWVKRGHQVFDQWARLRVPVVAAINGHALGGGLELAAVADIRIASESASFGLPEAGIATCPGWSGTQRLARLIGASRVKYLALTGLRLDSTEAWRIGLIHERVKPDTLLARAQEIAQGIGELAPVSVQLVKQLIDAGQGDGAASALEAMAGALAATTQDAREGLASFREKRSPDYQGN
jgi:enoyl-CoA hydratase